MLPSLSQLECLTAINKIFMLKDIYFGIIRPINCNQQFWVYASQGCGS